MSRSDLNGWPAEEIDDELELTNLVDPLLLLCAVLLTMVGPVTVFEGRLTEVEPGAGTSGDSPVVTVGFDAQGQLTCDGRPTSMDQLARQLDGHFRPRDEETPSNSANQRRPPSTASRNEHPRPPPRPVIHLVGDRQANYGLSIRLRALLSRYDVQVQEVVTPEQEL